MSIVNCQCHSYCSHCSYHSYHSTCRRSMTKRICISALTVSATVVFVALAVFSIKLYTARVKIARLRKRGLPMPPWNPIFGHLAFCYKLTSSLPKDANPAYLPDMIRRELPALGPLYYLDTWPFAPQMLVVASTGGAHQITQKHSLPKYPALKYFLHPIAEGMDIVTMEGELWKKWRGVCNPGFSATYIASLTRGVVEKTEEFCQILEDLSNGHQLFRMRNLTDSLTMDIIGKIVMNADLNSQGRSNPLADGLRMQIKWLTFGPDINPFIRFNPVRPLVYWYNSRRMNKYVTQKIDARFVELQSNDGSNSVENRNKSIIDLVLSAYLSEKGDGELQDIDSQFKRFTMNQIKLFLFSGHDTTSSTVCYIFYILATNAAVLAQVRAEHISVFGSDACDATFMMISNPTLLNKIPYTVAVIKEVLRMYPAVSGTRAGEPNFSVMDDANRNFPTEGFLVWDILQAMHRDPAYWTAPDKFLPERWLVTVDDPLHPIKGAWRPFSHGPRNCIGQELAMLEMKIIMVMTARRFDFQLAYEEVDRGKGTKHIKTVYGERGYQIQRAQPSNDLPCRVTKRAS